jgi:Protein of unknown function (DUF3052)
VSGAAANAEGQRGVAERLGILPGNLVQQFGDDDDIDPELLADVVARCGSELVPGDSDDVVDVVLLWFRDGDGDLVDALVDARRQLGDSGTIWLLTPKAAREGHVEPSDIREAVPTAGLAQTSTVSAGQDWNGSRLAAPKTSRNSGQKQRR